MELNTLYNFLISRGGGIYQSDEFYDMCDQMGIMVWQEFMFAVALYPRDTVRSTPYACDNVHIIPQEFLSSVAGEVKHQVRRLSHHVSVVLWSGNNENQNIAVSNHYTQYILDYSMLYDGTVRPALMAEVRYSFLCVLLECI